MCVYVPFVNKQTTILTIKNQTVMKNFLSVLSSTLQGGLRGGLLILALLATTSLWAYDFQSGDLYYNITSDTVPYTVEVTYQYEGSNLNYSGLTTVEFPASVIYDGITYDVTSIGEKAFKNHSTLISVTIGNNVTSIGKNAFSYIYSLDSVIIGNNVTSIGDYAFYQCEALSSVTIGNSVATIGDYAFYSCDSLTSVTIPNSVKSIGRYAFSWCYKLSSISIGDSVMSIGNGAFDRTEVYENKAYWEDGKVLYIDNYLIRANGISGDYTIRDSTRVIANEAFSSCSSLTSITIPESVTSIGEYAFNGCSALTSITIPNSVTSIRNYTFKNCSALTSITIPNSVTSIGERAFENCSSLTSITIPENVTSIGDYAFKNCSSLVSVVWNATNYTSAAYYVFDDDTPYQITSFVFGDSVKYIPPCLCGGMSSLTSITIPNSVTSIGYNAFENCSSLTSITIPNSVTSIGGGAFRECYSLTSITIPESVTSIGGGAFENCSSLTSVVWNAKNCYNESQSSPFYGGTSQSTSFTFGDSVESIPRYLCNRMENLTSVTIGKSVTNIGSHAFYGCSSLTSVVWNVVEIKDFKHDQEPFSSSPITVFTFGDDVKSIPAYLCFEMKSLQSIVIPDNVDSVKSYAFNGRSSLKSVRIGEGLKYIDQDAFSKCTALESIEWNAINCNVYSQYTNHLPFSSCEQITSFTFGDSVEYIPASLCYNMDNITDINIPNSVTSIGNSAFKDCSALSSVIIGNSVTSIGNGAFYSCDSLTSVTIPNSVTSIGDYAFSKCSALSSAIIGNSVTNIGSYAFQHCSSLASVTIGNSVTSIGDYAFYGCSSLTSATIGNSVTSIGAEAFRYCNSLTSINLPNSVTSIGESAFNDCSALSSAIIGNSVTNIGSFAFYGCSSLTSITIPESVTSIGEYAFNGCSNLANLTIKAKSAEDYIQRKINYQLYKYNSGLQALTRSLLINGKEATKIVIPENIDSIGDYTFYNCSHIQSITLHDDIYLDKTSFDGCDSIASITITTPSIEAYCQSSLNNNLYKYGLKTATRNILVDNEDITLLIIPESISSISEYLFYNCSTITSLIIPENIESIGYGAFYGCGKLEAIYQTSSTPPTIDTYAFTSLPVCYIPYGSLTAYENSTWKKQVSRFVEEPITGYQIYYTSSDGNVVTPSAADAFTATIMSNVYENGQGIITFNGFVYAIKAEAFLNCPTLTSITIPVSIKRIEDRAFANCSALGVVEVESTTPPTLGTEAFTSAPTCYIPCGTKHFYEASTWANQVSEFVEEECNGYQIIYTTTDGNIITPSETVDFGAKIISNVYEFGQGIMTFDAPVTHMAGFSNCNTLTSITIPESVTTVEGSCFGSCSLLTSIVWNAKHVEQVKWGGGSWLGAPLPAYDMFEGVRSQITSFVFGESVEYIPDYLCYYMENLREIIIPESVQGIGTYAFSRCSALTSAVIGNNVKTIGEHAFSYCSSLTSTTIGKSVITIGEEAFRDCSALTSIVIPDSVLAIENSTFFNCSALTSVTLNNSLISIYDYAFMDCSSLTSITIPENVTYIGSRVFYDCSALTSVTWNAMDCGDFVDYYSDGRKDPRSRFEGCPITSVTFGDNVEYIPGALCYQMTDIQSIELPENVYSIGDYAFYGCSSLTSITIPEHVYSMGERAFYGCSSLTSITIPENVSSIGGYAFSYCSSLKTVAWNAINPEEIIIEQGSSIVSPFSNSPIESLIIGDRVTYIPKKLCDNCSTLTSVTIGKKVKEIGADAFYGCSALAQTNYTGDIAGWCQIALGSFSSNPTYNSKNLFINGEEVKDVVIPNTVTSISSCAFYNCEKISSLTISENVKSIGYNAFGGCKKLFDIYCYPTTPPEAQENSFTNYNVNLYVPCESLKDYQMDMVFGSFKYIQCLEDTPPSEPQDTTIYYPTEYGAICEGDEYYWRGTQITEAGTYTYVEIVEEEDYIYHNIYTLELTVQPSETVVLVEEAYDSYEWHGVVYTESGSYFYEEWCYQEILELTIIPSTETAVDNMQTDSDHSAQKILRDNQLLILRDGVEYTIMGAEIK